MLAAKRKLRPGRVVRGVVRTAGVWPVARWQAATGLRGGSEALPGAGEPVRWSAPPSMVRPARCKAGSQSRSLMGGSGVDPAARTPPGHRRHGTGRARLRAWVRLGARWPRIPVALTAPAGRTTAPRRLAGAASQRRAVRGCGSAGAPSGILDRGAGRREGTAIYHHPTIHARPRATVASSATQKQRTSVARYACDGNKSASDRKPVVTACRPSAWLGDCEVRPKVAAFG
jgi:hypothetical protein